jgi:hypothetical protein
MGVYGRTNQLSPTLLTVLRVKGVGCIKKILEYLHPL